VLEHLSNDCLTFRWSPLGKGGGEVRIRNPAVDPIRGVERQADQRSGRSNQ
jgi:hypothetical protein